ncbi:MAG: cobalamin-binding protein [Saprospiraceae bacterium]
MLSPQIYLWENVKAQPIFHAQPTDLSVGKRPLMQFTDQMGRRVAPAQFPPRRIVSLVPSQTELLADLGLGERVVGITKFCVRPQAWFQEKQRVGGTKTLDFAKIAALQPDLLIGNKEENERAQIEYLAEKHPVWMSDIRTLADALDMIRSLGQLTGTTAEAEAMAQKIEAGFAALRPPATVRRLPSTAYLIWRKPYMAVGRDTFIHEMLGWAGFENVFADRARYPEITAAELAAARPDVLLLSSEPYPFAEKHLAEFREICPAAEIHIVDGELFSWYGSRLSHAPDYFKRLREAVGLIDD